MDPHKARARITLVLNGARPKAGFRLLRTGLVSLQVAAAANP
jgi:hypothetical protein